MDVKLKKWELHDKESLIRICNSVDRNYLSDRLSYPYTDSSAEWWLNMVAEHEEKDGVFRAIIVNNEIVGTVSVEQKADIYRKDAEIGCFLLTQQWSKGIMSKAVNQVCELAFKELDIIRITGLVYEENTASKRVLEKNGFIKEGVMKNAVIKNDTMHDLCVYGKLK